MAPRELPPVLREYERWCVLTDPDSWDMTRMRNAARCLSGGPKVSILVPVYNPERSWLVRCFDSVVAQTYPNWELCVCDDASTRPHVRETLELYARVDGRVKLKLLEENENIVGATNHALSLASGEWVGLLDHDDELAPHALFEVVRFLGEHPNADLVYSDEDKIDEAWERSAPHFKTRWSHDLAMGANYLNHFSVYRRTLLEELGGWREGFDGAQDLELVQRVGEKTDRIYHLPKVLYHWRMVAGSTAVGAEGKSYTHEKARRAIGESLERQGIKATVEDSGLMPNTFRVRREILGSPRVSTIAWSPGGPDDQLLRSLRDNTAYEDHEVFALDTEGATLKGPKGTEKLGGEELTELLNEAVRRVGGEYVALIGPGLESASGEWLESMLQHAQREEVGAVGGKLVLPSGEVHAAGLYLTDSEEGGRPVLYRNVNRQSFGYDLYFALDRDCTAVPFDCIMFRKQAFEEVGGFDDIRFDDAFADVDLCLRMRERGRRVIFAPHASFVYRGPPGAATVGADEAEYARERWGSLLAADPYRNPNLSWDPEDVDMIKGRPFHDLKKEQEAKERSAALAIRAPRPSVEVPPPFFVVGHGRSGTTWLELTLNSHPEVVCKGSGMFFGREMQLYEGQRTLPASLAQTEDLRTWHGMRPNYWTRDNSLEEDLPGLVRAVADYTMGAELARTGKRLAGDRTPHHVYFLEELHALYPEAKVIHIIRDGRDVAISNIHAIWQNARDRGGTVDLEPEMQEKRDAYLADRKGFLERGEGIFTDYRVSQLAGSWRDAVEKGRGDGRRLFGENYAEVRYEDLLEEPHRELGRLLDFLGVGRDPETVARMVEENSFERVTGRRRGEEDPSHFNRKGVAGDWREVLTEEDRRLFEGEAGALLAELGYESMDGAAAAGGTALGHGKRPGKAPRSPAPRALRSSENPPFFVVGHGRSGTTWSERLLNSHPEVLCVGSGMFFGRNMGLFEGRKTLWSVLLRSEGLRVWHAMQTNYWSEWGFEKEVPGYVKAITDHVLYSALEGSGKKLVGDRTPHHVSCMDEIHALYPEAKVIHIIRDGRDVAISNIHAFWNSARDRGGPLDLEPEELELRDAYFADRESFLASGESIFTRERINKLARGWRQTITKGREDGRSLFGDNYLEIRYETLLEDPNPELERVFSFLGASKDAATIERVVEENRFEKRSSGRSRGEEDSTSFLRKGIHGDWKGTFNVRDKKIFKRHAGDLLVELGYEKDLNWQ
jgi:GT2 family glycosyltransferase